MRSPAACRGPDLNVGTPELSGSLKVIDHEARQGSKLRARDQNPGWWGVGFRDDERMDLLSGAPQGLA